MNFGCYVHVPFCAGDKCPYCGFYSVSYSVYLSDDYVPAVIEQGRRSRFPDADTLYFGGGTPTVLPEEQLEELIGTLARVLPLTEDCEISSECSPETLTPEKGEVLADSGVTRISLGIQSMLGRDLMTLGRRHKPADARKAVEIVKEHDLDLSVDLIYGIPGQTPGDWEKSLELALELEPDHISTYGLSYEEGTPFAYALRKGMITPIGAETERKMYHSGIEALTGEGFEHYEISNFARPGKESRHNLKYWTGAGYMGLGPAAHSYIPGPPRWMRMNSRRSLRNYLRRIDSAENPWDGVESLDLSKRSAEFLMLRLRLTGGFTENDVTVELPELDTRKYIRLLTPLLSSGHLVREGERVRIPEKYLYISDSVVLRAVELSESYVENEMGREKVDLAKIRKYVKDFYAPDEPSPQK